MAKLEHPSTTDPHYAWFECPGCGQKHAVSTGPNGWRWNGSREAPTLSPSVLVRGMVRDGKWDDNATRCHSFVTNGRIQFLDDCSHALRGWHDLPEIVKEG